ncbi:hypothetical protein F2Y18_04255 [Bacillus cereus]|nr:hypothetical protein F2Y18_04255 [Bacillus cereus]
MLFVDNLIKSQRLYRSLFFFLTGVTIHAHQLNILKYPPNEKIVLLKVNIELEYRLSRINN